MKVAVIDLGTNTFNLLIAEIQNQEFKIILNKRESVKIGKGGIHQSIILPDAIERAMNALENHFFQIKKEGVENIIALGTSALRTASNAEELIIKVKERFGISISVISGEREAELIFHAVAMSMVNIRKPYLILDIGGGSNEFIVVEKGKMIWKNSFPLGMARLNELFKFSNPIRLEEIATLQTYFDEILTPLFKFIEQFPVDLLVGAEGAFESIYNNINLNKNDSFLTSSHLNAQEIAKDDFFEFYNIILKSTSEDRLIMSGIEPYRVEMIVPAAIFINYIVEKLKISNILVSWFSLKEGVIFEALKNNNSFVNNSKS